MFKVVSKCNSDIKRILKDVIYYKNYLHTFCFAESKELLDHINIKQLKVFHFFSRVRKSNSSVMDSQLNKLLNMQIVLLGIFSVRNTRTRRSSVVSNSNSVIADGI